MTTIGEEANMACRCPSPSGYMHSYLWKRGILTSTVLNENNYWMDTLPWVERPHNKLDAVIS